MIPEIEAAIKAGKHCDCPKCGPLTEKLCRDYAVRVLERTARLIDSREAALEMRYLALRIRKGEV